MKLLIVGDVHLGTYRYPIRPYIESAMEQIEFIAQREHPNAIIFCGDAFRHNVPSAGDTALFGKFMSGLLCFAPVLAIPGNHDIAGRATTLDVYRGYEEFHLFNEPGFSMMFDTRILLVPWLAQRSADGSTRGSIEAMLDLMKHALAGREYIMVAHATALGSEFADGVPTTMGDDVPWPSDWFDGPLATFLGHIHNGGPVAGAKSAYYVGSICPVSFNETEQTKRVMVWEDGKIRSINLEGIPEFIQVTLPITVSGKEIPIMKYMSGTENCFLQIKRPHDYPDPDPKDIPSCIWYEVVPLPPVRDWRPRLKDASTMTPEQVVMEWLKQNGAPDANAVLAAIERLK